MRKGVRLAEREEFRDGIRLGAMREAEDAGSAHTAAGRLLVFGTADALQHRLSASSGERIAGVPAGSGKER